MTARKRSRNTPCPCGSGRKYKHCCWNKGFVWGEEEPGQLIREIPLSAETLDLLKEQQHRLREHLGREPNPEDPLFFDAPPLEQVEHQLVQAMKRTGIDPALIHAFEQTGLLVSTDNQHLIPEADLQAWHAAVADYRARNPPLP